MLDQVWQDLNLTWQPIMYLSATAYNTDIILPADFTGCANKAMWRTLFCSVPLDSYSEVQTS